MGQHTSETFLRGVYSAHQLQMGPLELVVLGKTHSLAEQKQMQCKGSMLWYYMGLCAGLFLGWAQLPLGLNLWNLSENGLH